MSFQIIILNAFKKDIKKLTKQGKDLEELYSVIEMLAEGKTLPDKNRDHLLVGNWKGHRECHIRPDWLLIYKIDPPYIYLERTGSHSELFS